MLLLTCPCCGVSGEETEFAPGGEAHLKRVGPGSSDDDLRRLSLRPQESARRAFRTLAARLRLRQVVPCRALHRTLEVFGSYPAQVSGPTPEVLAAIRARRPGWEGPA